MISIYLFRYCQLVLNITPMQFNHLLSSLSIKFHLTFQLESMEMEIQYNQMKYQENGKIYTSSNPPYWFNTVGLQGYKVPNTKYQIPNYLTNDQKENKDQIIISNQVKGFVFDKSLRPDFISGKKNHVPPPNYYFKSTNQNLIITKKHQSSFFKKYPRFQTNIENNKKKSIFFFQEKIEERNHRTFSKAQLTGFIDSVSFKAEKTPGPGEYNNTMNKHKSLSVFSKGRKNSFLEKPKKQQKSKAVGPQTYIISRSLSLFCSAKLHEPYKQLDQKMKQKISAMNEQKQKLLKAASGNYLKIQEWCKYRKDKKIIPNRFNVCSKPQLKIYP